MGLCFAQDTFRMTGKTPLLERRGGSRPSEASVWRRGGGPSSFAALRMTESLTVGNPPPRLVRFASLIGLGTPSRQSRFARCRDETPVQEGSLNCLPERSLCHPERSEGTRLNRLQESPPGQEGWIQTERSEGMETGWWIFQVMDFPTS